jgi:hypothetical protein
MQPQGSDDDEGEFDPPTEPGKAPPNISETDGPRPRKGNEMAETEAIKANRALYE